MGAPGAFTYVVALGDDALVHAQRLGWWISRAPELEEDLALANLGLDQLGQARLLLTLAGQLEGRGRTEDDLAYWRDERDFRNVSLVERPMTDFGVLTARLLGVSAFQSVLYDALLGSTHADLAAIAAKARKEVAYHLDHAAHWVVRLGDGTEESHRRMQAALESEWPWLEELFDPTWLDPAVLESGLGIDPAALRADVLDRLRPVLARATLTEPGTEPAVSRGRLGLHTEHLGYLLAELQHLTRSHPGATW